MSSRSLSTISALLFFAILSGNTKSQTTSPTEAVSEPTLIQLKSMQERKFVKPYEDVVDAISTSVGYTAGKCRTVSEPSINTRGRLTKGKVLCHYTPKMPESRAGFGGLSSIFSFIPYVGAIASVAETGVMMADMQKDAEEARKQVTQIQFELSFPKQDGKFNDNETIVKMVMFQGPAGGTLVKIADLYAENFKKLADALFIQALEIPVAEQQ